MKISDKELIEEILSEGVTIELTNKQFTFKELLELVKIAQRHRGTLIIARNKFSNNQLLKLAVSGQNSLHIRF